MLEFTGQQVPPTAAHSTRPPAPGGAYRWQSSERRNCHTSHFPIAEPAFCLVQRSRLSQPDSRRLHRPGRAGGAGRGGAGRGALASPRTLRPSQPQPRPSPHVSPPRASPPPPAPVRMLSTEKAPPTAASGGQAQSGGSEQRGPEAGRPLRRRALPGEAPGTRPERRPRAVAAGGSVSRDSPLLTALYWLPNVIFLKK